MLIATFDATTGWAGKEITFENDAFVLEGHGPIPAGKVMEYDKQGHLVWANDGTRAWVGSKATDRPASLDAGPTNVQRLVKRICSPVTLGQAHRDIETLGQATSPQAIEALAGLLAGRQCDVSLRPLVAEQLKAMGPAAAPALAALLDVKRARPYALAALGSSVAPLVYKLKHPDAANKLGYISGRKVRLERVRTVQQIGELGSSETLEALVGILDAKWSDYGSDVFAAAAQELAKMGEPGRAALTSLLNNKNARPHAQKALGLPPSPMPQRAKPCLVRTDEAVVLQLCRVLGGSGLPLQPGETCDLTFLETELELLRSQPDAETIRVPYRDIMALEIGGPGAQQSGGGFFGGGFGVEGAVGGMLAATALNLLTTRTKVDTVVCLQTSAAELYLHTEAATPDELRMSLSPVFTRLRNLQAARTQPSGASDGPPVDTVARLAMLSELHAKGELTDDEFAAFKAKLMA